MAYNIQTNDPEDYRLPLLSQEEKAGGSQEIRYTNSEDEARGIQITCNLLSYAVKPNKSITESINDLYTGQHQNELLELLHGVYATFSPGELVCLMGNSGSGKTTFLNVLSGRAGGVLMGEILYNGKQLPQNQMRLFLNYIPQDDILMSALTPRECLSYIAELRLNTTEMDRTRRVEALMAKLGINRCADVMIGDALNKGISGGQRKRVSVGMELVTNPSILFVDEATTGLDSQTAEELIGMLKDVARSGRTVICTIHQPSYEVFTLFDRLLLLDSGRVVYNGDVSESKQYFAGLGHRTPQYVNPIEHFMKVIVNEKPVRRDEEEDLQNMVELSHGGQNIIPRPKTEWHAAWKAYSRDTSMADSDIDLRRYQGLGKEPLRQATLSNDFFDDLDFPNTFGSQFVTLLRRSFWMTWKDPKQFRARLILCTLVGLFGGLVYLNLSNQQKDVKNKMALMFQCIFFNGTNMLNNTVVLFPLERAVITREFKNGSYRMLAYYLARVITGCTFQVVYSLVFVTILYWMAGLNSSLYAFLAYLFGLMLLGNIAVSLGIVIGGLVPTVTLGPAVVSPLLIPLSVFSGFLVTPFAIKSWFLWLYYISFFQYTFHFLMLTQFNCADCVFDCCGNVPECNPDMGSIGREELEFMDAYPMEMGWGAHKEGGHNTSDQDLCPYGTGFVNGSDFVASYYKHRGISVGTCIAVLLVELFVCMICGFLVMRWRGQQKYS